MSAGRSWIKELYVGFLLLALTFLYLSHLTGELRVGETQRGKPAAQSTKSKALVPVKFLKAEHFIAT